MSLHYNSVPLLWLVGGMCGFGGRRAPPAERSINTSECRLCNISNRQYFPVSTHPVSSGAWENRENDPPRSLFDRPTASVDLIFVVFLSFVLSPLLSHIARWKEKEWKVIIGGNCKNLENVAFIWNVHMHVCDWCLAQMMLRFNFFAVLALSAGTPYLSMNCTQINEGGVYMSFNAALMSVWTPSQLQSTEHLQHWILCFTIQAHFIIRNSSTIQIEIIQNVIFKKVINTEYTQTWRRDIRAWSNPSHFC